MSIWLNVASTTVDDVGALADKLAALRVACTSEAAVSESTGQDDSDGRAVRDNAAFNMARSLALSGGTNATAVRDALVDELGGAVSGAFVQDPYLVQIATVSLSENAGLDLLKERIMALPEVACHEPDRLRLREMVGKAGISITALSLTVELTPPRSCLQNGLMQGRILRETASGKGAKVTLKKLKLRNNSGVAITLLEAPSEPVPDKAILLRVEWAGPQYRPLATTVIHGCRSLVLPGASRIADPALARKQPKHRARGARVCPCGHSIGRCTSTCSGANWSSD